MSPHLRPNMKRTILLALLLSAPLGTAEIESDIPLGLEAVTGIRSGYVFRGFDMANALMDFQLEGEITLSDHTYLNLGGWLATENGGPFEELAAFLDLRTDLNDLLTLGTSVTYHDYEQSMFKSGVDVGAFVTLYPTEDWDITFGAYHDFGAEGWYANAETGWSTRLGEDAFFDLTGGVSWVDDYYGRSGMNDFYGRASITYSVNSAVSLTPFLGWSMEIDDTAGDGDELFGGLWLELVF